MYQLFTDTDTDITPELAKFYGYKLISMPYCLSTGEEVFPYVDFEEFDYHTFYNLLRKGELPKTYALAPAKYIEYFEPVLQEGKDILYVHFSKAMSATFDSMRIAWEELSVKYPERKLHLIDTKSITLGSYNVVRAIGDLAIKGATVEELKAWAETEVDKVACYFYADTLKFFAKSGRITNFKAAMGSLIGIRPIITMNNAGKMESISKAKGRQGAMNALLDYVRTLQDNLKAHRVYIGHTDALDQAQELERLLKAEFGEDLQTEIVVVNPTAGSHCGPNTVGVSFHAIHR